jgi:Rad3-related DNA helicase
VSKVVQKHTAEGQRGIILTPSFKLQNEVVDELRPLVVKGLFKLFDQRQGEKLADTLTAFKAYKGGPAVLISPAMFEGIDLAGDFSRFQIMLKAPFPSLGDKRMKVILDRHPDIYNVLTVMKMVQGFGRSVRSEEDHATSYCLDLNGQRLFNGAHNIWKDEFSIRFTKFL